MINKYSIFKFVNETEIQMICWSKCKLKWNRNDNQTLIEIKI